MCGCLPPAQKRGLGGVGSEASFAPYPIVWDAAGSFPWLGLFAVGDHVSPPPSALLGQSPAKIIQYEPRRLEALG